ncbi:MAG: flippase [Nitrospinota bacterium]
MGEDTKARIFSSTSLLTVGVVVNALIGIVIARALARYLGVAGYGQYALAFVYLNFTAVIANFGFDAILIREVSRSRENANVFLTAGIVLKLAFGAGAVLLGGLYVAFRGFAPGYTLAVWLLLLTHFVAAFDTLEVAHKAHYRGGSAALGSMCSQLLTLGVVLWGRSAGWPLEWLIVSHVAVRIPRAGIFYLRLRSYAPFHWTWDAAKVRFVLRESAVIGLTGLLWVVYFRVDQLMLEWMKGVEAVGQYAAAYRFVDIALVGSGLMMASLFPLLSERWSEPGASFRRTYRRTVDYMAMAGAVAAGLLAVFSADLIHYLFSPRFTEAVGILRILSIAVFVIYLNNAFGHALIAVGVQGPAFLTTRLVGAFVNVSLNLLWIPRWGGYGAAWATVLSEGAILLIAPLFVRSRTGFGPRLGVPLMGAASIGLAWLAYRAAGAGGAAPTLAGRLAGAGVIAAVLGIFLFSRRQQVRELVLALRARASKPSPPPSPSLPEG